MGKLTVKKLESLSSSDIGKKLFDGDGLYGRVREQKTGLVVTFEYRFKLQGKERTTSCGKWPAKSLREVRKVRDEKRTQVEAGNDPVEQNKAKRLQKQVEHARKREAQVEELSRIAAEDAARRTFSDAIAQWEKLELSRRKDSGKETIRAFNKDVMPILGDVALVDIKRAMLVDIFDHVIERGSRTMANHLFGDLRQFFTFAITREWIESHPLLGLTKEKVGGRQTERDRYLSEEEIVELQQQLPDANLLHTTELAIWIMLSTCCRVGELTQARWEHISLKDGEWHIPAGNSKNAKTHTIFLSEFTKAQFQSLHAITGETDWCYAARDGKSHINLKSLTKQVKDRMRSEPLTNRTKATGALLLSGGSWTPHDLRRTGATTMGELGVMGEVIERCLNHVEQNRMKRIYQRHELKAEQREAWRILGERITLLLSFEDRNNLIVGRFTTGT